MFCNSGCGCNNSCGCGGCNSGMNCCRATPIVAPRKVCTSCSNQYVEQPIICPIECRHINNIVYYPRYYPRYERTFMTQSNGNPFASAANATPFNGAGTGFLSNTLYHVHLHVLYRTGSQNRKKRLCSKNSQGKGHAKSIDSV
jgi:hypothetical protein